MSELCDDIKSIHMIFYNDYISAYIDIPTFMKKFIFNNIYTNRHCTTRRSGQGYLIRKQKEKIQEKEVYHGIEHDKR